MPQALGEKDRASLTALRIAGASACNGTHRSKVLIGATCWHLEGMLAGRVETENILEGIKAKLRSLVLVW